MDCHSLELALEALLDGRLTEGEAQASGAHLATCAACRELVELATLGGDTTLDEPSRMGLLAEVLARTSGPTCGRAAAALAAALDGVPSAPLGVLLEAHLASCPHCRALAATLEALRHDLPRLASVRPDHRLLEDVLAATLPAVVRGRRWWARTWPRWVQRPRFASEAAFVAGVLLLVLVQTAGSPLLAASQRVISEAQLVPRARATLLAGREAGSKATSRGWAQVGTFWQRIASSWEREANDEEKR